MRLPSLLAAAVVSAGLVVLPFGGSPPAEAVTETGFAIVANQNGSLSCPDQYKTTAYDDHVLLTRPFDGGLEKDFGKPATISGRLNEAKPYANNKRIVALWGPSGGSPGGVGVFERATATTGSWIKAFALPSDWEGGDNLAHSVTVLPGSAASTESYAVAQTGKIGGLGDGFVVVFDHNGVKKNQYPLANAHGVEWDTEDNALYAVGRDHLKKYTYNAATFALTEDYSLPLPAAPDGSKGGHDIRRMRQNDDHYYVTTNSRSWTFDTVARTFTELKRGGASLGGVKSLDQRFDQKVELTWFPNPAFYFMADPWEKAATFCMRPYKVRWIYNIGDAVYSDTNPPPAAVDPGLPFLWEKNIIRTTGRFDLSGQLWVGQAAGNSPTSSASKITNAYNATPTKIPYVQFYQWGDSGHQTMDKVHLASDWELQQWKEQASKIAGAIGSREAYVVVEPEWDGNIAAHCDARFEQTLREVVGILRTAPNARILNGVGLWKSESQYTTSCFVTKGLNKLFHAHGVTFHLLSDDSACTLRDPDHSEYKAGRQHYTDGKTFEEALTAMQQVGVDKLDKVRSYFGGDVAYLTDLMVTSCGWEGRGEDGQRQLVKALVDRLQTLYTNHNFRGVSFRDGGPHPDEMFTGVGNESNLSYASKPAGAEVTRGRDLMTTFMANVSQPVSRPTFTAEVSGPTSVTPGSTAAYQVKVTNTGGSLSNGIVYLEVVAPGGTKQTHHWANESWTTGQSVSRTYSWAVPALAGSYTFKVGVYDSAWTQPPFKWNDAALVATVGAGESTFTSTATATPSTVAPDATSTIAATVTNTSATALTNGTVRLEVRDPTGLVTGTSVSTGQSIPAGTSKPYSMTWTAPARAGTYSIAVVVSDAAGTKEYHRNGQAGTVTVTSSRFTTTASPSRGTVRPSGATTITATVRNDGPDALTSGVVDVEAYDAANTRVGQMSFTAQNIAVGSTQTYTWNWTAPATEGVYVVKVVVSSANRGTVYHRNANAATVTVDQPSFTVTATTSPAKVQPGGPVTMTVAVTNTGGAMDDGVVDVELYTSGNVLVEKKFWENETLLNGQTKFYTWSRAAPTAVGTYVVKAGVFGPQWNPQYKWVDNADTFEVAKPTFTSAVDLSASSVASGGSVTIDATFTSTGAAMTNGQAIIEIWTPGGTKLMSAGKVFSGVNMASGEARKFTYTWPTGTNPAGAYRVKVGMFDSAWTSPAYHWNDNAGTVNVGTTAFAPSFRVGDGANTWWVEVYTSSDVTGVDVIGDNGRLYFSLEKKAWAPNVFAARPPSELLSGQLVQFVARRSTDGATAASTNFGWLTGTPGTENGWPCAITKGANSSTTWVEASACSAATRVWVKVNSGAWTELTYSSGSLKWGKAMNVSTGSKVVFRAERSDLAKAYSVFYTW